MELQTQTFGNPESERDLVPKEHLKGRKPEMIKDVFKS